VFSKDQTLGKYQILDRLGSGGFGTVYLALDTWVNRKVALKVPHQQQDEQDPTQQHDGNATPLPAHDCHPDSVVAVRSIRKTPWRRVVSQ